MAKKNDWAEELDVIGKTVGGVYIPNTDKLLGDFDDYLDTGCLIFNALLSGSIHGGLADNRITMLAGDPATGKTYFMLQLIASYLNKYPDAKALICDSEAAHTSKMYEERGIDPERVILAYPDTTEDLIKLLYRLAKTIEKTKKKLIVGVDSLSNFPTRKLLEDAEKGSEKKDMTKASKNADLFKAVTNPLAKAKIPTIVTNHVYSVIGSYIPTKAVSGGGAPQYAASVMVFFSKKKDKDDETKDVRGDIITCEVVKNRLTLPYKKCNVLLNYKSGLSKYYGLHELALKHGVLKKVRGGYEFEDGVLIKESELFNSPEEYYTDEILERLDTLAEQEYCYNTNDPNVQVDEVEELEEEQSEPKPRKSKRRARKSGDTD